MKKIALAAVLAVSTSVTIASSVAALPSHPLL
jgi:hypothetical protein